MSAFLGDLAAHGSRPALEFGDRVLSYAELAHASDALAASLEPGRCVAVWAEPRIETCVAVVAALRAGAPLVPVNPKLGERELQHLTEDCRPAAILRPPNAPLPPLLDELSAIDVELDGSAGPAAGDVPDDLPALVLYTSGTTGPPKGVILARRAIAANLRAVADAWAWTAGDTLVHALPLFHAHGLVLGILGSVMQGGTVRHVGRFDPVAIGRALDDGGTMLFAVPTMYHRLADACEQDRRLARALGAARILVSGSAALPVREFERIERLTGQRIVERYGLTETLMVCVTPSAGERRPGYVGPPLAGVELRLVDDAGRPLETGDDRTMGEVAVRGPSVFGGYLGQPDATAAVMRDGWFRTGDLATVAPDGYVRILGRRSTDLIKTGGYRVGAGEVESALLEHPVVAEAAVTGRPDDDLGERIAAWVVPRDGAEVVAEDLSEHVRRLLGSHKRPREVHVLCALPRNALGKVEKARLSPTAASQAVALEDHEWERVNDHVARKVVDGDGLTCTRYRFAAGGRFPLHRHAQEQVTYVTRGQLTFTLPEGERSVGADGLVVVPPGVTHGAYAGPDGADLLCVVTPRRAPEADGIEVVRADD